MIKKISLWMISFFIFTCILSTQAQQKFNNQWKSFYFGLLLGYSSVDYQSMRLENNIAANSIQDTGLGINLQFGYMFNRYLAAEFGAVYLRRPEFVGLNNTNQDEVIRNNIIYLVGRFSIPLQERLRVLVKGGIGYVVRSGFSVSGVRGLSSNKYVRPVYGVGLAVRPAKNWDIFLQWFQAAKESGVRLPASNYYGLGAAYLFM